MKTARDGHDGHVSRTSRTALRPAPASTPHLDDVPAADRATSRGWRDPRLWVGVALVAGSVVAGARVLASADETTAVWAAAGDLAAGQALGPDDLTATRVRFADAADAGRYLEVDEELPAELTLTRDLGVGELVPAGALGAPAGEATVSVSVSLPAEQVPTGVAGGSRVDVWVVEEDRGARRGAAAEKVLADVLVLEAPSAAESFAATTDRQVVLGVPEDEEEALARVLAASGEGTVRIVGRGRP